MNYRNKQSLKPSQLFQQQATEQTYLIHDFKNAHKVLETLQSQTELYKKLNFHTTLFKQAAVISKKQDEERKADNLKDASGFDK